MIRKKKIFVFVLLLGAIIFPIHKVTSAELNKNSPLPQFMSDVYQEENVLISFNRAYSKTDNYGSKFCIELNVKVLAENKIIKPSKNVYGIYILDNFGNDLNVTDIIPRYCDSIRPREDKLFVITFSIKPLENTRYLLIQIPKGIFGNVNPFELTIFNTGFKGPITKEERDRLESGTGSDYWQKENSRIDFTPDDVQRKKLDKILYAAIFVGLCASCSLGLILFWCLKTAKKTILCNQSFLSFFAHWLNENHSHLLIIYILSALISLVWLIFGIIIVIATSKITAENMLEILFFLSSWALLSFLSFWGLCEMLYKWRALNH
ncbi:MAG: hypothetical protein NTW93_00855 [Phycisphaerae bacterium]|nr:hypothetical protein [Phycisphaerae bacterium]